MTVLSPSILTSLSLHSIWMSIKWTPLISQSVDSTVGIAQMNWTLACFIKLFMWIVLCISGASGTLYEMPIAHPFRWLYCFMIDFVGYMIGFVDYLIDFADYMIQFVDYLIDSAD